RSGVSSQQSAAVSSVPTYAEAGTEVRTKAALASSVRGCRRRKSGGRRDDDTEAATEAVVNFAVPLDDDETEAEAKAAPLPGESFDDDDRCGGEAGETEGSDDFAEEGEEDRAGGACGDGDVSCRTKCSVGLAAFALLMAALAFAALLTGNLRFPKRAIAPNEHSFIRAGSDLWDDDYYRDEGNDYDDPYFAGAAMDGRGGDFVDLTDDVSDSLDDDFYGRPDEIYYDGVHLVPDDETDSESEPATYEPTEDIEEGGEVEDCDREDCGRAEDGPVDLLPIPEQQQRPQPKPVPDMPPLHHFSGPSSGVYHTDYPSRVRVSSPSEDCALPGEGLVRIRIDTDGYAVETSWSVVRVANDRVFAEGPPPGAKYEGRTRYRADLCLPNGRYRLAVEDAGGDGMCCRYGVGRVVAQASGSMVARTKEGRFRKAEFEFGVYPSSSPYANPKTSGVP
ncbi:hypothetical protein ACHAWF_007768, partial [Thalassiosira exigua]